MSRLGPLVGLTAVFALPFDGLAQNQDSVPDPTAVVKGMVERFSVGDQYTFDGTLELARRNGDDGRELLTREWVKLAVAPGGRCLFWAGDAWHLKYLVLSNGKTTWGYSPGTRTYMSIDAAGAALLRHPAEAYPQGVAGDDHDLLRAAELVVPVLRDMARDAALIEMNRFSEVQLRGEEQSAPVLSVLSTPAGDASQRRTELVLDPETADIINLDWSKSVHVDDESRFALLNINFEKFRIGSDLPATYFNFLPPGDAKSVNELPIPGLGAASLLNRPAPAFKLNRPGGAPVSLSDFRGKPVMLVFTAAWCEPCGRQMQFLARLQNERGPNSPPIVAIEGTPNTGGASAGGYSGPALGDAGGAVHSAYGVHFIPTTVLIDAQGRFVRFLPGVQDTRSLSEALKTAGL